MNKKKIKTSQTNRTKWLPTAVRKSSSELPLRLIKVCTVYKYISIPLSLALSLSYYCCCLTLDNDLVDYCLGCPGINFNYDRSFCGCKKPKPKPKKLNKTKPEVERTNGQATSSSASASSSCAWCQFCCVPILH